MQAVENSNNAQKENVSPKTLVAALSGITSISDATIRVNEAFENEDVRIEDIAGLISLDPALSAAVLRMSNSAIYGAGQVDTVERALNVIGMKQAKQTLLGLGVCKAFDGIPNTLITAKDFWKHSLLCAILSQVLSRKLKRGRNEAMFACGLLHDIGHLVMFTQAPELSTLSLQHSLDENDGLQIYASEQLIFGFDHMDVGVELAEQWSLPDSIRDCIALHHDPMARPESGDGPKLVYLANCLAILAEIGSDDLSHTAPLDQRVVDELGFDPDIVPELMDEAQEVLGELLATFVSGQ